jgi:hypothetical protein
MSVETDPEKAVPPVKRRWKRWTFVGLNLAGLLLVIPLVKVVLPLVGIWWNTRSQDRLNATQLKPSAAFVAPARSLSSNGSSTNSQTLQSLTNQLAIVDALSEQDIKQIVAQHFGTSSTAATNLDQFDLASAVFDSISRTNFDYRGKTYYGYAVNLVDQSGHHKTNIDCFPEPNLEYERSLQTLNLINGSPQLKKIYRAMAGSLAEQSSSPTNAASESSDIPDFRLEPEAEKP